MTRSLAAPKSRTRKLIIPMPAAVGLAVAAVPLTWWAVGDQSTGPDRDAGTIHVAIWLVFAIRVTALVVAAASLVMIALASRVGRAFPTGMSRTSTLLIIAAGVIVAAGGRITSASTEDANIGAGLVLLAGPLCVVALLVLAVISQRAHRPVSAGRTATWIVLSALAAPALWGASYAADADVQSRGVITQAAYNRVALHDTRSHVVDRLGSPAGADVYWFFDTPPAGSRCDYYKRGAQDTRIFRFCYRNGVLVAKQSSDSSV